MSRKKNRFSFKTCRRTFQCKGFPYVYIMGIINITPDSFSDGNQTFKVSLAIKRAKDFVKDGADILDLGAESTRPGADEITAREELKRLLPVLRGIRKTVNIPISIDTVKADVAEECLIAGADIINDVSGLKRDSRMAEVVKKYRAGLILMHMRGIPSTMQKYARYKNLLQDIKKELRDSIRIARKAGIRDSAIVLDPGIGFSKTVVHNYKLIKELNEIRSLGFPVLLGPSRKSFIGKTLGRKVYERLPGTLGAIASGIYHNADIVRVHDVKEVNDFLTMIKKIETTE